MNESTCISYGYTQATFTSSRQRKKTELIYTDLARAPNIKKTTNNLHILSQIQKPSPGHRGKQKCWKRARSARTWPDGETQTDRRRALGERARRRPRPQRARLVGRVGEGNAHSLAQLLEAKWPPLRRALAVWTSMDVHVLFVMFGFFRFFFYDFVIVKCIGSIYLFIKKFW